MGENLHTRQFKSILYRDRVRAHSMLDEKYKSVKSPAIKYPSCYRQNILVMLAKRLMNEERGNINPCKHKTNLHRKLAKEITSA